MSAVTQPATAHAADAIATVEAFLAALERFDVAEAETYLTADARWVNVGLPTVRGRAAIVEALTRMGRVPGARFTVTMHNIAADGDVVLTERTDELAVGPVGSAFWVCGTFELRDGRIAEWRDRFDHVDVLRGTVRSTVAGLKGLLPGR